MHKRGIKMKTIALLIILALAALSPMLAAAGGDAALEVVEALPDECTGFVCTAMANFPEINAWLIAIFTFLAISLRALAEFITFVGHRLNNEKTGQLGNKIESFARWAAQILGWFGAGTPKVTKEKLGQKVNEPKA
jgi:hypothetical protein